MFVDWIRSRQLRPSAFATLYLSKHSVAYKTRNYVNFTDTPLYMSNAARPMRSSCSAKARGKFRPRIGRSRDNPEGVSTMISMRNVTLSNTISHNWILLNRPEPVPEGSPGAFGPSRPLPLFSSLSSNPSRVSCESSSFHSHRRGCKSDYEPRRGMREYVKRIIKPFPRRFAFLNQT